MDSESPISLDDPLMLIEDDSQAVVEERNGSSWKILVVDDDKDVHTATELALRGLTIEGRSLELVHAHSGQQACELLAADEGFAVVLLDVVMESEDAGLKVVYFVREKLKRSALRIILRTGQPGYAPELETIRSYDINDYKTKSELTRVRLFTSLTTAIRAYQQMRAHEAMRRGLELVVKASTELTKLHGMKMLAQGVVGQLCALLDIEPEGLICAQAGLENSDEPARIIAAAGQFSDQVPCPLHELQHPTVQQAIEQCLKEKRSFYEPDLLLYFATEGGRGLAAYVRIKRKLGDFDRHLLEVFCASMAVGFENVLLYGRLIDQAFVDPMLRIPNLNRLLEQLAAPGLDRAGSTLAAIDIDDFSIINDTLSHEFGDALLHAVADRLQAKLPQSGIARLGSDIFGVLGPASEVQPEHLQEVFAEAFAVMGERLRISATIGLVRLGDMQRNSPELLKDAHLALKQAKIRQRGSCSYFSQSMGQDARERMRLLSGLHDAFESHLFFMVYQPKLNLADGQPSGMEALLRWRGLDGQLVPPDRFIPLAEQSGMMVAIGTFVLRTACNKLARLRAAGHLGLTMAINVSQAQLREPDFVDVLRRALNDAGVPAAQVELEITESMAAEDLSLIQKLLGEIVALGVKIAIDDFGTGFSSLSVLRKLPAHRLKIDRSFIQEIESDDSIARMVIGLGHSQGMQITAEGVENEAQREILCRLGCDEGQGWLFARPMEKEVLRDWLEQHHA